MKIHESGENYLETILILREKLVNVRSVDIANELNYTKPSVSVAMKLLKENGLISIDENGFITLTKEGYRIADRVYNRHTLLTKALVRIGVSEETAKEDACRIEHDISDETFDKLKEFCIKYEIV
ncbi:MAG: metal-dependent transcriptional regulator [Ruminococcaceae bacterium]|nr:metal-dependent transcriptional regulator [Oscillospiraceae bacterium]